MCIKYLIFQDFHIEVFPKTTSPFKNNPYEGKGSSLPSCGQGKGGHYQGRWKGKVEGEIYSTAAVFFPWPMEAVMWLSPLTRPM